MIKQVVGNLREVALVQAKDELARAHDYLDNVHCLIRRAQGQEIVRCLKTVCSHCCWADFKDDKSDGMPHCPNCNSAGYIYEEIDE